MLVKAQPVWLVDVFLMNNMELYGNKLPSLDTQQYLLFRSIHCCFWCFHSDLLTIRKIKPLRGSSTHRHTLLHYSKNPENTSSLNW